MQKSKKNILLIGIGGRARDVIIPAIQQMDQYQIKYVMARSERRVRLENLDREFQTSVDYNAINFDEIDIIIVAVKNSVVPAVIKQLVRFDMSAKTIMLDTPVWPYHKIGSLPLLREFKKVIISEDSFYINFYKTIHTDIQSGIFGDLKQIIFMQSGYRYHALAVLRMFTGKTCFKKIKTTRQSDEKTVKHIALPGAVKAQIVEPRNYTIGTLTVEGTRTSKTYRLADFPQMDQMKAVAFGRLLTDDSPVSYLPLDGIYDNVILKINDKLGLFYDIPIGKKSLVYYVLSILAKLAKAG